jgi:D-alanyl-lipoteichoic acid acyltransferase DltB (MBOAT superfamily)
LLLHFVLPHRFRWLMLLVASFYFYMAWRPEYIILLVGAIVVTYVTALRVHAEQNKSRRKVYLVIGLVLLLGTLFVFKYFNFFNESFRSVAGLFRAPYPIPALDVVLPIGISFYTFQLISYLVDSYRNQLKPERNLGTIALYAAFFPQLVAGPIERASHLINQFREEHRFDYNRTIDGFRLMMWGFFKKVVVADRLDAFVQTVYANPTAYSGVPLIMSTFFFAFQVYCDFSGYTDIARGAARSMGFSLVDNFDRPYFSRSIPEFWKRWHISLSTWLADYVYTPLTKTRAIRLSWYHKFLLSLLLTFLISGLWHGANWTFIAWGGLHGIYMMSSIAFQKHRRRVVQLIGLDKVPTLHHLVQIAATFTLVCISYVFFRAKTLSDALYIVAHAPRGVVHFLTHIGVRDVLYQNLLLWNGSVEFLVAVCGILIVVLVDLLKRHENIGARIAGQPAVARWIVYCGATIVILVFGALYSTRRQFIYFQF